MHAAKKHLVFKKVHAACVFYGSKTHLGARSSLVLVLVVRTHLHSKKASVPPIHGFVHPLTMAVIKQLLAKDAYMTSMCRLV